MKQTITIAVLLASSVLYCFAETGKIVDVTPMAVVPGKTIMIGESPVNLSDQANSQVTVQIGDMAYTGVFSSRLAGSLIVGDSIEARVDGKKLILKLGGKDKKGMIVRRSRKS